jgi:DNA-binding NarL/FixJ family response regulator
MEEKIFSNYKALILPFIQKLKNNLTEKKQQNMMNIIESNLVEFFEPFSKKLSDPMNNLTPTEIQIASMIKEGLSNKEIAQIFNNSVRTITNHREHIRRKLNLQNKKINLRSYLSTLS